MTKHPHLDGQTIGDVIKRCVPEEYQHFFATFDENGDTDSLEWQDWDLDLNDEDSIGTHVRNLLPLANEMVDWMTDWTKDDIENHWKRCGDQVLTWVRG